MTFQTHIEGDQAIIRTAEETRHFCPLGEVKRVLSLGVKNITVDLGDVSFIDSEGLGELVKSHACAQAAEARLRLINVTPDIRRFLNLTNIQKLPQCD